MNPNATRHQHQTATIPQRRTTGARMQPVKAVNREPAVRIELTTAQHSGYPGASPPSLEPQSTSVTVCVQDQDKDRSSPQDRNVTATRFWAKVSRAGEAECWQWRGARNSKGYGIAVLDGRAEVASRVVWMLTAGPIPPGLQVCHTCDTPLCVNPAHLFLGTARDNARDKVAKGRAVNPLADANRAKTHCPQGHEYTPDNLTKRKDGQRSCLVCDRLRLRNRSVRRGAA